VKPLENNKLLKTNEEEMGRLKDKFSNLEKLIHGKLKSDTLMNSEELQKRYSDIEGQMRQYLNKLREEHKNKLIVLKEMEDHYKEKIAQQNKNNHYQDEL
jgi:gas vesicle protein